MHLLRTHFPAWGRSLSLAMTAVLLVACGDRTTLPPSSRPLAVIDTEVGAVELLDFEVDSQAHQLVVQARFVGLDDDRSHEESTWEFRLGPAPESLLPAVDFDHGFAGILESPTTRSSMAFGATRPREGTMKAEFQWRNADHDFGSSLLVDLRRGTRRTTLRVGDRVFTHSVSAEGTVEDPQSEVVERQALEAAQEVGLSLSTAEQDRLEALLFSPDFQRWLVASAGKVAGRDLAEVEILGRWTDSTPWRSMCAWAGVGSLASGWCVWNPFCGTIFIPSISMSAVCAIVTVVETVGDWFGWWGN